MFKLSPAQTFVSSIVLMLGLGIIGVGWWVARILRPRNDEQNCLLNLKALARSVAMYRADHDSYFMSNEARSSTPTASSSYGWTQVLQPYVLSDAIFRCPGQVNARYTFQKHYTDYWFNQNLTSFPYRKVSHPEATYLMGEGSDGLDDAGLSYQLTRFPATWLVDRAKPPFRHTGGANYLFADGHMKWLAADQISRIGGRKDPFSVR